MTARKDIEAITERIRQRSQRSREIYLGRIAEASGRSANRARLSCGNLAHGFAVCSPAEKVALGGDVVPNLGIITSYNDMLSAHQPFETYPALIKEAAREAGGIAQVAGGVPAMCDGVTQGQPGMELSLFSRDVIAMSAAIGLSHNMFDAAVFLGVCDKIVPGLLIAALTFGHLPAVFIPAGPMTTGLPNDEKAMSRPRSFERWSSSRTVATPLSSRRWFITISVAFGTSPVEPAWRLTGGSGIVRVPPPPQIE